MIRQAAFTALFAVVATVSVVSLLESAARPFGEEAFSLVQWVLFGVTMAGAIAALVRSLRYYATLAAARRVMPDPVPPTAPPPGRGRIWQRLPTVLDDVSWVVVACLVATVNVLAVVATIRALDDLAGDSDAPVGWLIWQLAVLVACSAALTRFTLAATRELWDRARRRRRNAIHVVTGRLLHWPGEDRTPSPARRAISCALTALLAATAWATGSGPLLDAERPGRDAPVASGGPGLDVAGARPVGGDRVGRGRPRPRRRTGRRERPERAATTPPTVPAAPVAQPIAPGTRAERREPDRRAPERRRAQDPRTAPEDREPAPGVPPPGSQPAPASPEGPVPEAPGPTPAPPPVPPPAGGEIPCPEGLPPEVAAVLPSCGEPLPHLSRKS